jgi:hypothetical protein
MRGYVLVGIVAALIAYGVGERQAGGAVIPANCYTFQEGGQGCGCGPTDCADCINGTPPTCSPATHIKCYTTNILTPVEPGGGGYTRILDSKPCGGVYYCFNEGGGECIGPCVDGSFCENLPGNPTFNYYKPDAECAVPH